jgi:hypothetical protein
MGMASGPAGPDTSGGGFMDFWNRATPGNHDEKAKARPKGKKRAKARQKTPEQVYAKLIAQGLVRVVRRKGKPPLIEWL